MTSRLEARLRKLETTQRSDLPLHAATVFATTPEDAERQIAHLLATGRHRPGWPLIVITGRQERTHA